MPEALDPHVPIRSRLRAALRRALEEAVVSGELPATESELPVPELARPADPEHGDQASNVALQLARPMRRAPLDIGRILVARLEASPEMAELASATLAPPGFINLRLSPRHLEDALDAARRAGPEWGRLAPSGSRRVNVEFVSANPTGPLHVGNARGAFVGDLLSRVLEAAGDDVVREYYFNDFGSQVRALGASVRARRRGEPIPEDGYRGDYVGDLAVAVPEDLWRQAEKATSEEAAWLIGRWASEQERREIEASLERLGVHFDVWKTESSLHEEGWVARAVERLRQAGHVYELDGATWFRSTDFGDDKDRVIYRSNGQPTYFAADIGYVTEKFSRGFDRLIYVWGENHHGAVARTRNAAAAMGFDREQVVMLLYSWVRFVRDGKEISMSKRSGEFISLDELLGEVGPDAARWFFGSRAHTSGIDFDLDLATDPTAANPVHYVRYAHARICSILRKAAEADLAPAPSAAGALDDEVALGLAKQVLRLPEVVEDAAAAEETQGVTGYATELATTFHAFYRDRRVIDPADPTTSGQRLALAEATRLSLANTLGLLGISAPESM
jgi:arginyl-tRNA synthetase